jgi:hypothetical protein
MKTLNPNDFGKKLVEDCQKIKISDFLKQYKLRLKELILNSEIELLNIKTRLTTSKTSYSGIRFWFQCPECKKRIGVLYKHPITNHTGCRTCLNLDYRRRIYKGMLEERINELRP